MDNSNNNNNMNILDLPNEMLINIFNKLNMVDVLYSLVDINERFDRLIIDSHYIHHLDMTMKSSSDDIISIDNKVSRICENILPRIHDRLNKLIIEPSSIKSILAIDYPQLYSLSLINFQDEIFFQYLKVQDDSILRNLLSEQITDLTIDIDNIKGQCSSNLPEKFTLILSLCKKLTSLNFHYLFRETPFTMYFITLPPKTCMSSTLTKLKIQVMFLRDCLYLLDGRLDCLSTLIINVKYFSPSPGHKTKKLLRLKHFSLMSSNDTIYYEKLIIPLLCRMINLEELTLFLSITRVNSNFLDGFQLYDQFLILMPQLNKFTFSIITNVINNNIKIDLSSHKYIQSSFIGRRYEQVGSCIDVESMKTKGTCHIYSYPYQFDFFLYLDNSFQGGIFKNVRYLMMIDTNPFEHKFFKVISEDFPFLRYLEITNDQPQKEKQHVSTLITFAHLTTLNLCEAHVDYAEQFLFRKITHLPLLFNLYMGYDSLSIITNNFTNDVSSLNFSKLEQFGTDQLFVRAENFQIYFPFL